MKQRASVIDRRLDQISREKEILEAEFAMLSSMRNKFLSWPHLLKEDDALSHRNCAKFELLARIVSFLSQDDVLAYGGATTREIFLALNASINEEIEGRKQNNQLVGRPISQFSNADDDYRKFDPGTPLVNSDISLNYNTFRSHLARFKAEGRLFVDEESNRWKVIELPTQSVVSEEDSFDEEYEKSKAS